MNRAKFFVSISLVLLILSFRFLDENFLERLKEKLNAFNKTYREERVYLQLDKTLYKPGDDIWYKVYLLDGSSMMPSTVSTVLYVELLDPRGSLVKKSELQLEDGTSHGDLMLDKARHGGLYTVRAYTRWMQNFGEENYFTKLIQVQSVITPRLLLKIDFEKKAYGKNDLVKGHLKARNLKDQPLAGAEIKAQLKLDDKDAASAAFITNSNGEADIEFTLPPDLNTKDGLIQAVVSQDGIEESISRPVPIVLNKIQIRFFPEGGEWVANSNGKMAFEATNEFGKGADVKGVVVDGQGREVSTFESFHMGMGAFRINAEPGRKYVARITRPEGTKEVFVLPDFKTDGMTLAIEQPNDSTVTSKIFTSKRTQVYLVGHVHSRILIAEKISLYEGWNEKKFSTKSFPIGILTFTLFDSDGNEVAEGLSFINIKNKLNIELSTDLKEYKPGEKVNLSIKTTNLLGQPIPSNLSLAVVDDQLITTADDKQDNILSWMLLGAEVKGKIEEPSFYFDESEPKANQALDLLLMVHGWRRFAWKEVLSPNHKTLSFLPENESTMSGFVMDSKNKNKSAEVVLLELENRKRIAKVKADKNGQFHFRNVDASTPMILMTKKPNMVEVNGVRSIGFESPGTNDYWNDRNYRVDPYMEVDDLPVTQVPALTVSSESEVDVNLSADVTQLSEIVVTGYGVSEEKRVLGTSATTIVNSTLQPYSLIDQTIENQLMGRVSGLTISQSGQPGSNSNLQIRGISSLANRGEPLWIVDGVPISGGINSNFSTGSQLTPGNIRSITVVKATEATSLFGSAAANGAILIETKTRPDFSNLNYVRSKPKYSILSVKPRTFTLAREFYTGPNQGSESRNNFKSTVYWQHTVITDKNGEAKISFYNNDLTTTFRITAEGISGKGLIGRKETTYFTLLPFSLDAKLPDYLGFEDTLSLPVRITNNTASSLSATLSIEIPDQLKSTSSVKQTVIVNGNQTITVPVSIFTTGVSGGFPIKIKLESNRHQDEINKVVNVHPVGFPVRVSYSGKSLQQVFSIQMEDVEKGSVRGDLTFLTDPLDDLFAGAESMLQEPHGCFEQVSSSTFPNILALQYLKQTGRANPALEKKALALIETGYKMLKGYEIRSGGFEWFGKPPAHLGLSAYGLLEFSEMKKVFGGVDDELIQRTATWLLKMRKGDGTFKRPNDGYDGFSHADAEVINAYVVYAFSEAGMHGVEFEYQNSLAEVNSSHDMYRAALMANAAINYQKIEDFNSMTELFTRALTGKSFEGLKIRTSVTSSYGSSLITETAALWALALMKSPTPDFKTIRMCIEYIGTKKSFGMYGSTQATYLSLKAITEYHKLVQGTRTDGEVMFAVNSNSPTIKPFTKETKQSISFTGFENSFAEGNNKVQFSFLNTKEAFPFSLNLEWSAKTPLSNQDCKLKIETKLSNEQVKVNEGVRLKIILTNQTNEYLPMSMAVVGIPAGLSLQPWQMKELSEKNAFDFYEIIGDKLALYYRAMKPNEGREINLDLKAELPGQFLARASCAYLYYASEFKYWVNGNKVKITK